MFNLLTMGALMLLILWIAYWAGYAYQHQSAGPGVAMILVFIAVLSVAGLIFATYDRVICERLYEYPYDKITTDSVKKEELQYRNFCYLKVDKKP